MNIRYDAQNIYTSINNMFVIFASYKYMKNKK